MNILHRLVHQLGSLQLTMAAIAVIGILLTVSLDVLLRTLANAPFSSTIEIVSYYNMVPIAFLPIAMLEISDGHIRTDLFYQLFPSAGKVIADLISGLLTIGIYGLLSWVTFKQALAATKNGELAMGVALLPIWPVRWILPFVFAISTVIALLILINRLPRNKHNG